MVYGSDPFYLVFLAPGLLLAAWASWKVQRAYAEAQKVPAASGVSGAETAQVILSRFGMTAVRIEVAEGFLSDHYDPVGKVLRLSPDVYEGRTLAALGITAHEAGHALQDATHYPLLKLRNGIVPLAAWGGNLSWILILLGFALSSLNLIVIGIVAFSLTLLFQIINLPVEFDASQRARQALRSVGLIDPREELVVKKVLSAAALTYVAATLTSLLTLAYYLYRSGLLGSHEHGET
ncbi:zinc metallopeptidase [Singulisphaera sp. Ch08]|uniref:Zinc metallopeptidase n=1 Tax=Singulisphaera sp. Ch08 TaxID=3120278 RepID=A0AAU7CF81_9BACT